MQNLGKLLIQAQWTSSLKAQCPSSKLPFFIRSLARKAPPKHDRRAKRRNSLWKLFVGAAAFGALLNHVISSRRNSRTTQLEGGGPIDVRNLNNDARGGINLRQRFNFINQVVEKCAPSVVYVEIRDPLKIDKGTDHSMIVSNGSGFIVSEDGWILTNAHVVINKPNASVQVKLQNGEVYVASVEDADMNIDLALIKVQAPLKLPALKLGKSGDVSVGEWVVALGSPLSLSHSATAGVVSCVSRAADELGLRNFQMRYIQTDAPITFGNSGGPLVNLDGEVIGINNLRITAGISFAIPVEFVENFLQRNQSGSMERRKKKKSFGADEVCLGITAIALNEGIMENLAAKYKFPAGTVQSGVLVWKIIADGRGEKAGLKVGDVITHVNGRVISSPADIYGAIDSANMRFSLKLVRDGKTVDILVNANQ